VGSFNSFKKPGRVKQGVLVQKYKA
jgi:hypothetical protein